MQAFSSSPSLLWKQSPEKHWVRDRCTAQGALLLLSKATFLKCTWRRH